LIKNKLNLLELDPLNIEKINFQLENFEIDINLLKYFPEDFWKSDSKHIFSSDFIIFIKDYIYKVIILDFFKLKCLIETFYKKDYSH